MENGTLENKHPGALLRVLTAHFRALAAAGSDQAVLRQYSALLRFLKSGKAGFLEDAETKRGSSAARPLPTLSDDEIYRASLDEILRLVRDDATPRKDLEFIAIRRFSVPRGSMRSFSNRQMLVDKLVTLITNERTHETIGAVARNQGKVSR